MNVMAEIVILLLFILVNGLFAMAEIALVSSRKSKLRQLADQGNDTAKITLALAENPTQFLATVQVGITFVGIFAGAFGARTVAQSITPALAGIPGVGPYADSVSLVLVVTAITYLSLVIGELVPKRLALGNPEGVAMSVAGPMQAVSRFADPVVRILSRSTEWLVRILRIRTENQAAVSEEEVRMMITEGARMGVFNLTERDIVERTFRLSDKKVTDIMTPRNEIRWLDTETPVGEARRIIRDTSFSYYPVCRGNLDRVAGVVRAKELLTRSVTERPAAITRYLRKPIFVPESMDSWRVLEMFKKAGVHVALVVDEYGSVRGLLSMTDILEEIVGDIPTIDETEERTVIRRDDGSYLVDGLATVDEFKEAFGLRKLPGPAGTFHTVGGFVMHALRRIPKSGDSFDTGQLRIEVMDMDGNRVDKVLVRPKK